MRRPPPLAIVAHQYFPAPDLAVAAVARAVEAHADDRFIQAMFRHARGHVRVMMLHRTQDQPFIVRRPVLGVLRGGVIGMKIMRDMARPLGEHLLIK